MVRVCEEVRVRFSFSIDIAFPQKFSIFRLNVPGNFSHDFPDESSPLTQVSFHARNSWFWLARGDLLCVAALLVFLFEMPCFPS